MRLRKRLQGAALSLRWLKEYFGFTIHYGLTWKAPPTSMSVEDFYEWQEGVRNSVMHLEYERLERMAFRACCLLRRGAELEQGELEYLMGLKQELAGTDNSGTPEATELEKAED